MSGTPTVSRIISAPRALISGLMETFSMDRICVGMVSTPAGRQNRLAVVLSKEMVKASRKPASAAGKSSGSVIEKKVGSLGAERHRCLLQAAADAHQPGLDDQHHEGDGKQDVPHQQQPGAALEADRLDGHEKPDTEDGFRNQRGQDHQGADQALAREVESGEHVPAER